MDKLPINKAIQGDAIEVLSSFPSESIDLVKLVNEGHNVIINLEKELVEINTNKKKKSTIERFINYFLPI